MQNINTYQLELLSHYKIILSSMIFLNMSVSILPCSFSINYSLHWDY